MKKAIRSIIAAIFVAAIVFVCYLFIPPSPERIFKRAVESVAELKASSASFGDAYGTAVLIDDEGTLVTNAHIVTYFFGGETSLFESYSIRFSDEEEYRSVKLIKYDLQADIAVLRAKEIPKKYKAIALGNSDKLSFGNKVYAIGNGSNYGLSITQGIVSIPKINIRYEGIERESIQCDLTVSSGNSGGALLDGRGKLVGITTFRVKDGEGKVIYGLAYSIPINIVLEFVKSPELVESPA